MNSVRKCLSDGLLRVRTGGICHGLSLGAHRLGQRIPSLFIVSLPRSFSSHAYALARGALPLQEPRFTTFGEILNFERFPGYEPIDRTLWRWFTRRERKPATFYQNAIFLDRVVEPRGFAYKDVVQPFVVAAWLRARKEFRILRIRRNLADVAIAMLQLSWLYPTHAAASTEDAESSLIEGLILADDVLSTLPAMTVEYDDLIRDGVALSAALSMLYPECDVPAIRFRNHQIEAERAKTLARRDSRQFRELERKICDLRASLPTET